MKKDYITEEEFDNLSDYEARNYVYCMRCKMYHINGTICPCNNTK